MTIMTIIILAIRNDNRPRYQPHPHHHYQNGATNDWWQLRYEG